MVPKGSGCRQSGEPDRMWKQQRADVMRQRNSGANRVQLWSERPNGLSTYLVLGAKQQAGNVDPGMEPERFRSRCRRAKGRGERPTPIGV